MAHAHCVLPQDLPDTASATAVASNASEGSATLGKSRFANYETKYWDFVRLRWPAWFSSWKEFSRARYAARQMQALDIFEPEPWQPELSDDEHRSVAHSPPPFAGLPTCACLMCLCSLPRDVGRDSGDSCVPPVRPWQPRNFCRECDSRADYLSGSFSNGHAFFWCYEVCKLLHGWSFDVPIGTASLNHRHVALQLLLTGMPLQGVRLPSSQTRRRTPQALLAASAGSVLSACGP
jgi:hypothetical protein